MTADQDPFHLDRRAGWPDELTFLLARWPRERWGGHANLGQTARFWLARHDMFRELGGALAQAMTEYREQRTEFPAFARWFTPNLRLFLDELDAHHRIEDQHYFPLFAATEARLARGFQVLEGDHHLIEADLHAIVERANALLRAGQANDGQTTPDPARRAAEAYVQTSDRLLTRLLRHLRDEEDLIVPLILERGESSLGM